MTESTDTTLATVLAGTGGLSMQGTGMLNLTGINTYTGPIAVTNGRLTMNGSITNNVTVGPGGNLGGTGIINGGVLNGATCYCELRRRAPGSNFTVFGAAPQTDSATFSLAANTAVAPGVSFYARYDGEMGTGVSSHALNGGLRVSW